ncbi:MAG: BrnT family toxin [Chloroflexota bacterium]
MSTYEWDENKARKNICKHGIGFDEASSVFDDSNALMAYDPLHSRIEERYIYIGRSVKGNILVVVYTQRGETTRIISCRKATSVERKAYEKQKT